MILPLLATVWNESLVQNVNDLIGTGMGYAFGNPIYIGMFILFLLLGTLYALGFTLDVNVVLLAAVVLLMGSFPALTAQYSALPNWVAALPLFLAAIVLTFAVMKIFRK